MVNNFLSSYKKPTSINTNIVAKELPELSFVEFEAWKLRNAELAWINEDILNEHEININVAEEEIINNFAYVSEGYTKPGNIKRNDRKTFLADRYGSRYEVCNGGSARCGMNGNFQIKGIGKNPLVANNIDYNHSHGKMCLAEAINEAIWGEVCHQHLPYGAIRTIAIIKTGTSLESNYGLGNLKKQPCALAIRQSAVRPAHFERATFFWPSPDYHFLRDNDYLRVKEAVLYIERAFGVTYKDKQRFGTHSLFCALMCFVERLAKQIAVSRIKGIPHGSLTSSNIALDGRFLDFGTITAVPDFSNYVLAGGQGGIWDDHIMIADWIQHLTFYLNKYSECKLTSELENQIIDYFLNQLDSSENIELSKQLGLEGDREELNATGCKFKEVLLGPNSERKILTEFNREKFLAEIEHASIKLGIEVPHVNFELRQVKYSKHTIATDEMVSRSGGSREAITKLITSYC